MAAGSYSEAVRNGSMEATRLHVKLGTRAAMQGKGGSVDVFDAAFKLELPILFRPLKGLLGAYLPEPTPGALVTTTRPMSVQRFTGAHELGHHRLKHSPSLDDDGILRRGPMTTSRRGPFAWQEVEANAFATSFLMPRWLIEWHCLRQGWIAARLHDPATVYQLSLRLGQSYEATTWTLELYNLIPSAIGQALRIVPPRTTKVTLLGDYRPADYRADVWLLSENDRDTTIEGSRNDHFVLRLTEHSGAGYLWSIEDLRQSGFLILRDSASEENVEQVGGPVVRSVTGGSDGPRKGTIELAERRPWDTTKPFAELSVEFDFTGPEEEGFSRAERRRVLEEA